MGGDRKFFLAMISSLGHSKRTRDKRRSGCYQYASGSRTLSFAFVMPCPMLTFVVARPGWRLRGTTKAGEQPCAFGYATSGNHILAVAAPGGW